MDFFSKIFSIFSDLLSYLFFGLVIYSLFSKKNKKAGQFNNQAFFELIKKISRGKLANIAPPKSNEPKITALALSEKNTLAPELIELISVMPLTARKLVRGQRYLQVALNSTLEQARDIILKLPNSERIIIELGTPLLKVYGLDKAAREFRSLAPNSYLVADLKISDLADREVILAAQAGVQAATCLGVAPVETIESFINACEKENIDSMIDMMNVVNPLMILRRLKKTPRVVILHRGVDESEFNREKQIPYYQIKQLKGSYNNILIAVAGGDTAREVQSSIFNGADIVVVWKDFYESNEATKDLADNFLKEIK